MKISKKDATIYSKAADAILKHGHARSYLQKDDGSMCIWGAISLVVDGKPTVASTESHRMLAPLSKILGVDVIEWNNEHDRTKRQVLGLLRKAARQAAA